MTYSLKVAVVTEPVSSVSGISKSRSSPVSITVTGVLFADLATLSVVFGKSTLAPTRFDGFVNPNLTSIDPSDWAQYRATASNASGSEPFTVTVSLTFGHPGDAAWSIGDHIWFGLYPVQSPSAADSPLAVAGPLLVIA